MSKISRPSMNPAHPPRFYELPWPDFEELCRDLLAEEPTGEKGVDLKAFRRR